MDIYFRSEYGKMCEEIEGGNCEIFEFSSKNGRIRNMFIKRAIPILVEGKQYYDIITPYGYGGPIVLSTDGNKDELLREYDLAFQEYCIEQDIVSEFVRFHPIYNNAMDFQHIYNVEKIRNTIGTNLCLKDPIAEEFGKSCRKNIRRALNAGISYKITENPDNIDTFIDIYYNTMTRDNAAEFYYFSRSYFNTMIALLREKMILVEAIYENRVIAANICFVYDKNIHIHLSGTLSEYLRLSPAYILRYAVAIWGKENGLYMIHHGGGVSNSEDDSLYRFKKQFGKNTEFEFHIGKAIYNKSIYDELCRISGNNDCDFFPAYRKR